MIITILLFTIHISETGVRLTDLGITQNNVSILTRQLTTLNLLFSFTDNKLLKEVRTTNTYLHNYINKVGSYFDILLHDNDNTMNHENINITEINEIYRICLAVQQTGSTNTCPNIFTNKLLNQERTNNLLILNDLAIRLNSAVSNIADTYNIVGSLEPDQDILEGTRSIGNDQNGVSLNENYKNDYNLKQSLLKIANTDSKGMFKNDNTFEEIPLDSDHENFKIYKMAQEHEISILIPISQFLGKTIKTKLNEIQQKVKSGTTTLVQDVKTKNGDQDNEFEISSLVDINELFREVTNSLVSHSTALLRMTKTARLRNLIFPIKVFKTLKEIFAKNEEALLDGINNNQINAISLAKANTHFEYRENLIGKVLNKQLKVYNEKDIQLTKAYHVNMFPVWELMNYYMINLPKEYFTLTNGVPSEIVMIKDRNNNIVNISKILNISQLNKTCMESIYNNNATETMKLCEFKPINKTYKVTSYKNNELTIINENKTRVVLTCDCNPIDKWETNITLQEIGAHIMTVPRSCNITINNNTDIYYGNISQDINMEYESDNMSCTKNINNTYMEKLPYTFTVSELEDFLKYQNFANITNKNYFIEVIKTRMIDAKKNDIDTLKKILLKLNLIKQIRNKYMSWWRNLILILETPLRPMPNIILIVSILVWSILLFKTCKNRTKKDQKRRTETMIDTYIELKDIIDKRGKIKETTHPDLEKRLL